MSQLVALFWHKLGQWCDTKHIDGAAQSCYKFAAKEGGKYGARALLRIASALTASGAIPEALQVCRDATNLDSTNPDAWNAQGASHRLAGQIEDARRCFDKALELAPTHLKALCNIGELHLLKGDATLALECFDQVLDLDALFEAALINRAAALIKLSRISEAETVAKQALDCHPDSPGLLVNFGCVNLMKGDTPAAAKAFARAHELDPDNDEARLHLALLNNDTVALAASLSFIRHKIELEGETALLLLWLTYALRFNNHMGEAEATCQRLVKEYPEFSAAWTMLAQIANTIGEAKESVDYFKKALALPCDGKAHEILTGLVFATTELGEFSLNEVFNYHRQWAERYETPLSITQYQHPKPANQKNRLKLGYISGDLRVHPVGSLLQGVLQRHDHNNFEIHCFSTTDIHDDLTATLRSECDQWHEVMPLPFVDLAAYIKDQNIDILVDLSGHTSLNRLQSFALKPAAVQVTWIGYFHSTGLDSIDYFITDPHTTPVHSGQLFSETPAWLPHSRFCFTPPVYAPAVSPTPADKAGYITFGSFNRLSKLDAPAISAWVRIVNGVPGSKLLLKAREFSDESIVNRFREKFQAAGLAPESLTLRPASGHLQMLNEYSEVDIALDPFPFNGGMTTLEALWMGVPVIALTGNSVVSRQSASMLINIGLKELLFDDLNDYVAGAIDLAGDTSRLANLRKTIRRRMASSPLCDADQFTQDLELLYQHMWQAWCRGEKLSPQIVAAPPVTKKTVLHVGCGPADIHSLPVYFQKRWKEIRFDIDDDANPDVIGSALDMSAVPSGSVDAVYSSHMLEHLYAHELPIALAEMKRVLKPNGFVLATVPDMQAVASLIADDQLLSTAYDSPAGPITPFDITYGHRGYISNGKLHMAHRSGFTLTTLTDSLRSAGFGSVSGKRREPAFDLWIVGTPSPIPEIELKQLAASVLPE